MLRFRRNGRSIPANKNYDKSDQKTRETQCFRPGLADGGQSAREALPERSFRKKDKKASSFPEPTVITRPGSLISFPFRSWPCGRLTTEPGSSFQGPTSIQPREFCAQKRRRRRTAQQCGRGRPYARRKYKITAEETNRESFRALVRAPSARDGSNKRAPVCD